MATGTMFQSSKAMSQRLVVSSVAVRIIDEVTVIGIIVSSVVHNVNE